MQSYDCSLPLFTGPVVAGLCVFWSLLWVVLRDYLCPRACSKTWLGRCARESHAAESVFYEPSTTTVVSSAGREIAPISASVLGAASGVEDAVEAGAEETRHFYIRKLRRMQVYCVLASVGGLGLFIPCFWAAEPLEEMLGMFGPVHQLFFTVAVGHWSVNLWEDWRTRSYLGQGLTRESMGGLALFPLNLCCSPNNIMLMTYFAHHAITIFAYCYTLATHRLGGVMVQGLLFEIPVCLMLRRECAVAMKTPPAWLLDPQAVNRHWMLTYFAFFLGRCPAECLWVVSVFTEGEQKLKHHAIGAPGSIAIYHVLAAFFTAINLRLIGLYMSWQQQDNAFATEAVVAQRPSAAAGQTSRVSE